MFRLYVLLLLTKTTFSSCDLSEYVKGESYVIFQLNGDAMHFPIAGPSKLPVSRRTYHVHCPASFRIENVDVLTSALSRNLQASIQLTCDGRSISFDSIFVNSNTSIECPEFEASYYLSNSSLCPYDILVHSFMLGDIPITLAEVCFNPDTLEILFFHHVIRSNIYKYKEDFLNSKAAQVIKYNNKFDFEFTSYPKAITIEVNSTMFDPQYRHLTKYFYVEIDAFVTNKDLFGHFKKYVGSKLPVIPWWTRLRDGNWRIYQQLLLKESRRRDIRVFAGTSHDAKYPDGFVYNDEDVIEYEIDSKMKLIPQYIWNYVIDTRHKYDFVVIGVNTPFFDSSKIICEDVCSKIALLKKLEKTRKFSGFGYIFCCQAAAVKGILDGFPQISLDSDVSLLPTTEKQYLNSTQNPQL